MSLDLRAGRFASLQRAAGIVGKAAVIASSPLFLAGTAEPKPEYEEGQVWEYKTRSSDTGSLLKIQMIETSPDFASVGAVYHVSIIGVNFRDLPMTGQLQHAPFSKAALDASVTRISASRAQFPDAAAGIAEWRAANGGVFTVTVADAVDFAERAIRGQTSPPSG